MATHDFEDDKRVERKITSLSDLLAGGVPPSDNRQKDAALGDIRDHSTIILTPEQMMAYHQRRMQKALQEQQDSPTATPADVGVPDMPAPRDNTPSQKTIVLGKNTNTGKDITITDEERLRHISVVGATGTRKSTLLRYLALQAIDRRESLIYIDVDDKSMSDLLVRIPKERMNDVILLDFSDRRRSLGIHYTATDRDIERAIELMKKLWEIGPKTPNLENTLRASLKTLQYNRLPLDKMPDLLRDKGFREKCLPNIPADTVDGHFVRTFWEEDFNQHDVQYQIRNSDSTLNKIMQMFMDEYIAFILAQMRNTLDIKKDILDKKKILLVHLSKFALKSEERVRRIGAMILEELKYALFFRDAVSHDEISQTDINLICDEWQLYLTPDFFEDVLSQGRRYRVSAILATQTLANFDDKLQAILDQVGTHVTFAVGVKDAYKLAPFHFKDAPPEVRHEPIYEPVVKKSTKEVVMWTSKDAEDKYNGLLQQEKALLDKLAALDDPEQRDYSEELKRLALNLLFHTSNFERAASLPSVSNLSPYTIDAACQPDAEDIQLSSCQKVLTSHSQEYEQWGSRIPGFSEKLAELVKAEDAYSIAVGGIYRCEKEEKISYDAFKQLVFLGILSIVGCFGAWRWIANLQSEHKLNEFVSLIIPYAVAIVALLAFMYFGGLTIICLFAKVLCKIEKTSYVKEKELLHQKRDQCEKELRKIEDVLKQAEQSPISYIISSSVLSPIEKRLQVLLHATNQQFAIMKGSLLPPLTVSYPKARQVDPDERENFFDPYYDNISPLLRSYTHPPRPVEPIEYETVRRIVPLTSHEKDELTTFLRIFSARLCYLLEKRQREYKFIPVITYDYIDDALSLLSHGHKEEEEKRRRRESEKWISVGSIMPARSWDSVEPSNRGKATFYLQKIIGCQRERLQSYMNRRLVTTDEGFWLINHNPDIVSPDIVSLVTLHFEKLQRAIQEKQNALSREITAHQELRQVIAQQLRELLACRKVTYEPVIEYESWTLSTGEVIKPYYRQVTIPERRLRTSIGFSEGESESMSFSLRGGSSMGESHGKSISISESEKDITLYREVERPSRPLSDREKEKFKELVQDMPDGIAYVAMRMRGGRFQPRMETYSLEEKNYYIRGSLEKKRAKALENAIPYTTGAQTINDEFRKRHSFGIAPIPVEQTSPEERQTFQEEKEKEAPVPVSHAKRRTKEVSLSLVSDFKLPDSTLVEDLLMWLYLFGYLDIEQFTRLVHRQVKVEKHHITKLREKIKKDLVLPGLVEEHNKPQKEVSRGMPPRCYSLTPKGRETLGKMKRFTPIKAKAELGYHLMQLNELLVSAVLLPTVEPRITLARFEHEYLLRQQNTAVVPDGFVSYSLSEPYGVVSEIATIAYEWDEGSESPEQLRVRVTNWITAVNGAYRERFGTEGCTIAFCCQDAGRAEKMRKFAEEVLDTNRSHAELFLFGAFDPATIDPLTLLTTPLFKQPFDSNLHALIETHASVIVKKDEESTQRQAEILHQVKPEEPIQPVPEVPQPEAYQPYEQGYQPQQPDREYTGIQQMPYAQEAQEQQIEQLQEQQSGKPLSPAQPQQHTQPDNYAIPPILHLPVKQTIDENEAVQPSPTSDLPLEQAKVEPIPHVADMPQPQESEQLVPTVRGIRPAIAALTRKRYNEDRDKGLIDPYLSYPEWLNHEVNKILEEENK